MIKTSCRLLPRRQSSKEGHPCLTFLLFKHLAILPKVYAFESWDLEAARLWSSQSTGRREREGKEVIIRVEKKILKDGEHSKPTPGNSTWAVIIHITLPHRWQVAANKLKCRCHHVLQHLARSKHVCQCPASEERSFSFCHQLQFLAQTQHSTFTSEKKKKMG